jgi:hypothetical protein
MCSGGHFFGDVVNDGTRTDRVNLGYMVTGNPQSRHHHPSQHQGTYRGHIAGTVHTQGEGLRDRVGTFTNNWTFNSAQAKCVLTLRTGNTTGPWRPRAQQHAISLVAR